MAPKSMYCPKLKGWVVCLAVFATALFLIYCPVAQETYADTVPKINVKVKVSHRVHLKVIYQLPQITITEEDIQRGFIDVPSASRLEVTNTNPAGYLLAFEGTLGPFKEVHIQGLANPAQLNSGNAFILQPYTRKSRRTMELSYRCLLSEDTKPGSYSWPFSISAQTL